LILQLEVGDSPKGDASRIATIPLRRLDLLTHPGMVHPFQIINLSFPNAMSKRKKPKKQDLDTNLLSQINPNAAGIDIGADRHWVSIPVGRDEENIRSFTCFTPDL